MLIPSDLNVPPPLLLPWLYIKHHASITATDPPALSVALGKIAERHAAPSKPPKGRQAERDRQGESFVVTKVRESAAFLKFFTMPLEMLEVSVGALVTSLGAGVELSAATTFALHLGCPHTHAHPPAFPMPLPSLGPGLLGTCVSVLIGGLPAARVEDLGLAVGCGTFTPPFQIVTGSSKVFIGSKRAARFGDLTKHCQTAA